MQARFASATRVLDIVDFPPVGVFVFLFLRVSNPKAFRYMVFRPAPVALRRRVNSRQASTPQMR